MNVNPGRSGIGPCFADASVGFQYEMDSTADFDGKRTDAPRGKPLVTSPIPAKRTEQSVSVTILFGGSLQGGDVAPDLHPDPERWGEPDVRTIVETAVHAGYPVVTSSHVAAVSPKRYERECPDVGRLRAVSPGLEPVGGSG